MVAFSALLAFILALAGAMTGKYFLILVGGVIFIIPFLSGALLVGLPWWIWGVIILLIIIKLTKNKK